MTGSLRSWLNLTLVESYPSRSSEAGGLQRNQYVVRVKSQSKWFGLHPSKDKGTGSASFWCNKSAKLNSSYDRIARSSISPPISCTIFQETLRRWEKAANNLLKIETRICQMSEQSIAEDADPVESNIDGANKGKLAGKMRTAIIFAAIFTKL